MQRDGACVAAMQWVQVLYQAKTIATSLAEARRSHGCQRLTANMVMASQVC
jgi:hypothetical protein